MVSTKTKPELYTNNVLVTNIKRIKTATNEFGKFCHHHWHELKTLRYFFLFISLILYILFSKEEGKIFVALLQLVTDFEGEPWFIR